MAFSPDGRFLVSASADDTCKVWRVEDGMRMDTLPQPLKEEYCCAFSPDGRTIVAGGADNTIRVWEFVSRDKPRINPMVLARFAHEGPIVRLAFTPDGSRLVTTAEDRTVKVWETAGYTELRLWDRQPDVATGLAISGDGTSFRVGRMDGSTERYPLPACSPAEATAQRQTPRRRPFRCADASKSSRVAEREPNDVVGAGERRVTLPAEIAGDDRGQHRRRGRRRPVPLLGQGGRALGDRGRRGTLGIEARLVRRGARRQGQRIERVRLQAVRDSYFTFRGKDDSTVDDFRLFNWEEMQLNEYLYANGEVVKLWLYPRGPDSGFLVYPGQGTRWGYFDTTPLSHALGEPCYVVQPHPPGTDAHPQRPAGLPALLRQRRRVPPRARQGLEARRSSRRPTAQYLVKIKDVRGLEGPDFKYTLKIRPRRPDFQVTLQRPESADRPRRCPGVQGHGEADRRVRRARSAWTSTGCRRGSRPRRRW